MKNKQVILMLLLAINTNISCVYAGATTVYFKNTGSWPHTLYCYTWTNGASDQNAPWPGVEMICIGENIYSYSSLTPFNYCIFTNGMFQTDDLVAQDGMMFAYDSWLPYAPTSINGQCGDNLSWSFVDGVLTISGIGEMYDYDVFPSDAQAPWYHLKNGLNSVIVQNGVTSIGNLAFWNCDKLTSISIGKDVVRIGEAAFMHCSSLVTINIPSGVENISSDAFDGCNKLPIDNNIRYADTYLIEVIDKTLNSYTIKSGTKWIGIGAFESCTNMVFMSIPNSVVSIGNYAFADCSSLTSVSIPNSVVDIRLRAFDGCRNLTSIILPLGLKYIAMAAFSNCTKLQSVTIPNGVTAIGQWAFANCNSLNSITIPGSVTWIVGEAFSSCTGLTSVTCLALTPPAMSYPDDGVSSSTAEEMGDVFSGVDCSKIPLYVPKGSVDLYVGADQWEDFKQIIGIENDIISPQTNDKNTKYIHNGQVLIDNNERTYNMQGQQVE